MILIMQPAEEVVDDRVWWERATRTAIKADGESRSIRAQYPRFFRAEPDVAAMGVWGEGQGSGSDWRVGVVTDRGEQGALVAVRRGGDVVALVLLLLDNPHEFIELKLAVEQQAWWSETQIDLERLAGWVHEQEVEDLMLALEVDQASDSGPAG